MNEREKQLAYHGRWIKRSGFGVLSLSKFASKFPIDGSPKTYTGLYSHFMSKGAFNSILKSAITRGLVVRRAEEERNKKERRYALTPKGIHWAQAVETAMQIDAPLPPGRRHWRF